MPRSSRHKSSKHREVKEYSDSEKEFGLKEKKGRDDAANIGSSSNRHLKESTSGEKRKNELKSADICKDLSGVGGGGANVGYVDEFGVSSSLSKKRKEKEDGDRWTGGDHEHELSKSDSKKPSRREESLVVGFDGEEGKRSGSKVESKHHRSDRKERSEKEGASERERKSSKSERLIDVVTGNDNASNEGSRKQGSGEERGAKYSVGNTEYNIQEDVRNTDAERQFDRRVRRKRDYPGDGEKHQDGAGELDDRKLSSRDDIIRSGKYKDEGHKDERIRDRYQEDVDKENWHQDEKQRDSRATREYTSGRSEDKHVKNEKRDLDVSQKKNKPLGSEYDRQPDRERDRDHDYDRDRGRDRDRDRARHDRDRDRERDREYDDRDHDVDRDRDRERDLDRGHERDRELERDKDRGRDRYHRDRERDRVRDRDYNHDRVRDRDYDHDHDYVSHVDEKVSRYKDDRARRRSPDVYDDYHGDKSRRMESEIDKERSLSRKTHVDSVTSSSRHRASPSSRAYVSTDKYRDGIHDETKYGDSLRDGTTSETPDKVPKYRSGEKRTKFDENHIGEYSERSPSAKASPAGLKERSPSANVDRRFHNRTSRRRSLDVDEAERRSCGSNDMRDVSVNEDRQGIQGIDFSGKKPAGEEYPPPESPFHHKSSQGNMSSHVPGPSAFRTGGDSPSYMGPLVEDTRGHSGSRYRRSVDPNVGRGPGNAWKGPNWPSPLPNGFMPFPPGPPGPHHGGFPPMLSQFPPLFGVRPSMDMNHPGMAYPMPDGDRFPGHVRPMGWQNMVEGSVPPHFHGWDATNGVLRDESSIYGPGHLANAQRRDMNADIWKQNGDVNMDVTSVSQKDGHMVKASMDEVSSAQGASRPHVESSCLDEGTSHKTTSSGPSSTKEIPTTPAKVTIEKTPESSNVDDTAHSVRAYLAELDISIDMADPELYNQFINLAVKGQSDFLEEVEPEYIQEKTVAKPKIANMAMGLTYFPAPKDSIFQKAMDLYNTQSTKRRFSVIPNGETYCSAPASEPVVEQISVLKKEAGSPVDYSLVKEEPSIAAPEVVSTITPEVGAKEAVILTSDEALNVGSLPSVELAPELSDQGQMAVLTVDKMDEDVKDEDMNLDKGFLSAESTYSDAIKSDTETVVVGNDGKRYGAEFTTADEQLDVAVSGPLVLSHDSVKVCEALMSVSNESDSVILSRIHHAPESTH